MSQRNGDKARFGRQQYRKILLRKQMRELRKVLTGKTPEPSYRRSQVRRRRTGRACAACAVRKEIQRANRPYNQF